MSGYDIYAAIMMVAFIGVTIWGFKPMLDTVNKDLKRHKKSL